MQKIANPIYTAPFLALPKVNSWKETILISAVALAALSSFAQIFVGSFTSLVTYGFLATAAYLGYLAQQNVVDSRRREEHYMELKKSTDGLRRERLSFREENKILSETNESLKEQVSSLQSKLQSMEGLLAKIDASALLTKDLLSSCIDVSRGQKKTEERILDLVGKLEKGTFVETQKEVEKHVKQLESTVGSIEKQIKQFFLHDTKASSLLAIKQEFARTSKDLENIKIELERVQKELSETSSRLEKTSYELEAKITRLNDQETKLCLTKKLTPIILNLLKNPEIHQNISLKEQEQGKDLQKNWQTLLALP